MDILLKGAQLIDGTGLDAFPANLGIAQVEAYIGSNTLDRINALLDRLQADGLVVHVNPLQEWGRKACGHF